MTEMQCPDDSPLSTGITVDFMRRQAPELAKDIVLQLGGAAELAKMYGLDTLQWQALMNWPGFREIMRRAVEELAGPVGIGERIRRQARLALAEGGVADMAAIMGSSKAGEQHKVRAFEALADVAGMTGKTSSPSGGPVGGGPLVQINFPDGRQFGISLNSGIPPALPRDEDSA